MSYHTLLKKKNADQPRYRSCCHGLILMNFQLAQGNGLDNKIWEFHIGVNSLMRRGLRRVSDLHYAVCINDLDKGDIQFKTGPDKKKVVEQRKYMKLYVEFIKSGQRYYRQYIADMVKSFPGIPELGIVAVKLHLKGRTRYKAVKCK